MDGYVHLSFFPLHVVDMLVLVLCNIYPFTYYGVFF